MNGATTCPSKEACTFEMLGVWDVVVKYLESKELGKVPHWEVKLELSYTLCGRRCGCSLKNFQDLTNFQTQPKIILSAFPEPQLPENKGPFSVMMSQQICLPMFCPMKRTQQISSDLAVTKAALLTATRQKQVGLSWPLLPPEKIDWLFGDLLPPARS